MISDVDDDDNGYITLEEFIPLMTQVVHQDMYLEDEINEIFAYFGTKRNMLNSEALISKVIIASNDTISGGSYNDKIESLGFDIIRDFGSIWQHVNKHMILSQHD